MGQLLYKVGHGLVASDRIMLGNLVGGEGLKQNTPYYVLAAGLTPDYFKVSLTDGGPPIDFTTNVTDGIIVRTDTYSPVSDGVMDPPVAPSTPTGLDLTSDTSIDSDGHYVSRLKATWNANTNPIVRSFVIEFSRTSGNYTDATRVVVAANQTGTHLVGVVGSTTYYARLAVYDVYGTISAWSAEDSVVSAADTSAPSTPTGLVALDGILSIGAEWTAVSEKDLSHYEVQVDNNSDFSSPLITYSSKTTVVSVQDLTTGTWYIRIRAVDLTGNASSWTAGVSAVSRAVGTADVAAGAITTTLISDSAISTPKLAAGAVSADKLSIGGGRYLTNPDFETGDITGWAYGNTGGGGSYYVGNDPSWRSQGAFYAVIATTATGYSELWQIVNGIHYNDYIQVSALVANATGLFAVVWRDNAGVDISTSLSPGFPSTGGYGGTGPVRRSAVLGPAPAGTASVRLIIANTSVNGDLLIDDVWLSRVGDLITSDGNVRIDSSGITILNGKLVFADAYGATVMDGYGFGPAWVSYVINRVYNGDFRAGSTSDIGVTDVGGGDTVAEYQASVTSFLPGWVVLRSDGVVKITSDSAASGGKCLELSHSGSGGTQTNSIYQDIPVVPGEMPSIIRNWRLTRTANDVAVNVYVSYRDSNHALIGAESGSGLVWSATIANYFTMADSASSPLGQVPSNATYVRYRIETVHNTGSGTSVFFSDFKFIDDETSYSLLSTATLTLGTAAADIPGLSLTVRQGRSYLVTWVADFSISGTAATAIAYLNVDGSDNLTPQALLRLDSTAGRATVVQTSVVNTSPTGSGVIKVRANKTAATGTISANSTHCTLTVVPL